MSKSQIFFLKVFLGIFIFFLLFSIISAALLQAYIDSKAKTFPDITKANIKTLNLNSKYLQFYERLSYENLPKDLIEKFLEKHDPNYWRRKDNVKPNITMFLNKGVIRGLIFWYIVKFVLLMETL